MNLCPITYKPCGTDLYSPEGLKLLSPGLKELALLDYTAEEQLREAAIRASKMSIQGVQPKLFRRVIFNYLIGNEDMHLKNYSVIVRNNKIELAPAYDFLNSTIVLSGDIEEIALTLKGKKSNLNAGVLIKYFGQERCSLTDKVIDTTLNTISSALDSWFNLIDISFLSNEMKEKYRLLLQKRRKVLSV